MTDALHDELAIRRLSEAYADAVFRRDAVAWGKTWADDATWTMFGSTMIGRDAIVASWEAAMVGFPVAAFFCQQGPITIAGDRATGRSYTNEILRDRDGSIRRLAGAYDDSFVRTAAGWRFLSRRFAVFLEH